MRAEFHLFSLVMGKGVEGEREFESAGEGGGGRPSDGA